VYHVNSTYSYPVEDDVVVSWSGSDFSFPYGYTGDEVTGKPLTANASSTLSATASNSTSGKGVDSSVSESVNVKIKRGSIVVMTWIDESDGYVANVDDIFGDHFLEWKSARANIIPPRPIHAGCFPVDGDIDLIVPTGYDVSILMGYDLWVTDWFHVMDGGSRDNYGLHAFWKSFEWSCMNKFGFDDTVTDIILLVDTSGSMNYSDLEPGYNEFVDWLGMEDYLIVDNGDGTLNAYGRGYPHATITEIGMSDENWLGNMADAVNGL
jgi:hypothetical protein